jgi:hypothetical protein
VAERTGEEAKRLAEASNQLEAVSAAVSQAVQTFISAVSADIEERRRGSRHVVDKVIVVTAGGRRWEGHTVNVSASGMKLVGVHGLSKGEAIEIVSGSHSIRGKVAWAANDSCGVQFSEEVSADRLVAAGLLPAGADAVAA